MNLKNGSNEVIVRELKSMVKEERAIVTRILHYLKEANERELYRHYDEVDLFEWCVKVLGYSRGATQRRLQAMRLLCAVPEVGNKIKNGDMTLSTAAQTQSYFYQENLRRRDEKEKPLTTAEKEKVVESLTGLSARATDKKLDAMLTKCKGTKKRHFDSPESLDDKLEELQSLLSHQVPDGDLGKVLEKIADIALEKLRPKIPTSELKREAPVGVPASRYIPVEVKRQVWARDQGRCTYRRHPGAKSCGSRYQVQFDHLLPYALGGTTYGREYCAQMREP